MDFDLFKEVILGDVSTIIFGYSRYLTKDYIKRFIEKSICSISTNCDDLPIISKSSIPITNYPRLEYFRRFFNNNKIIVLTPFHEGYSFEFFRHNWDKNQQGGYDTMWIGTQQDYDGCIASMKNFIKLVPGTKMLFVKTTIGGTTVETDVTSTYDDGYCPILYVIRDAVKSIRSF